MAGVEAETMRGAGKARRGIPTWLRTVLIVAGVVLAVFMLSYVLIKAKVLQVNQFFLPDAPVGVDVSNHQAKVDMQAMRDQGMQFVYIKATEGASYVDKYFQVNWDSAGEAGLPRGAYHFFSFDTPGADQAQNYIQTVGSLEGGLVPVVDVEWYGDKKENPPAKEDVVRELKAFSDAIEAEYGVKPMVYATDLYDRYLEDDFDDYSRWVRSVFLPVWVYVDDDWHVWQYSDTGHLEGSTGHEKSFDLNVLNPSVAIDDLLVK